MIENNTTPPVLHQKYNSETSSHDINNNEIYYPKVTSTSKITSFSFLLHVTLNTLLNRFLRRSKVLLQTSSPPGQICRSIF